MNEHTYLLQRTGLEHSLHNIYQYPSTIVVAPMGYGKSTAILSFLEKQNTHWVLLSFDSTVSTAEQAWDMFATQLQKDFPVLGNQLHNLGYPKDYSQFEGVIDIFEDHCSMHDLIIVIDDFHNMHSPEFNETIQQLFMRRINGLHFLFITRMIPDFRLEELILKKYCFMIDSVAFELTPSQIRDYFSMFDIMLSDDDCLQVSHISEGWISAVCLIHRLYTQTGQIIKESGIENMLIESSKSLFTQEEYQVLMQLSFLDNFTLSLALFMINDPKTEQVLTRMCFHNLFIRFDTHSGTYRIHNILRSFFTKSRNHTYQGILETGIYQKAGQWFIKEGDIIQALYYFLKAHDYSSVLKEFEKTEITRFYDRIPTVIIDIFQQIPMEERYKNPIAYLSYIGFYVTNISVSPGFHMLTEAEEYFNQTVTDMELLARINGEIELIRAYINFNDLKHMRINLSKANSMLKGRSAIANPKKIPTFGSPQVLYLYFRSNMSIFETVEQMSLTYPFYYALSGGCGDGFEHQTHAEAHLETADFESAERYSQKAIYSILETDSLSVSICSYFSLARNYIAQGNVGKGRETLESQRDRVWNAGPPMLIHCYELSKAYIDCVLNSPEDLPKWITSGDLSESDILYQGMGFGYIIYGKYLMLTKDYLRLEVLCERMQKAYLQFKNEIGFLHMYILLSIAKYHLYGIDLARESLNMALQSGFKNKIILLFAEYGDEITPLLNDAKEANSIDVEYILEIQSLASNYTKPLRSQTEKSLSNLTERELETLKLVCGGKTNREISLLLSIAEITVRKNLTSIYRKLNVPNRASAIRKILDENMI